jgi:hypothetical protein
LHTVSHGPASSASKIPAQAKATSETPSVGTGKAPVVTSSRPGRVGIKPATITSPNDSGKAQ